MRMIVAKAAVVAASLIPAWALALPQTVLFQAFGFEATDQWEQKSLALTAGGWRIGALDGPVATQLQLASVLGTLEALTVSATCSNTDSAGFVSFCGLQASRIAFGGIASDDFTDSLAANAGWLQSVAGDIAFDAEWSGTGGDQGGGYIGSTNTSFDTAPVLLSLLAPSRYLGDASAALTDALDFSVYAVSAGGDGYSLSSGVVALTGLIRDTPPTGTVPEPSTIALFGAVALAGLVSMKRRRSS